MWAFVGMGCNPNHKTAHPKQLGRRPQRVRKESDMEKKRDWEAIEADWRAGVKTKQQMSIEHGVSRAAMDKRFAKLGIERDLRGKIQAKAEALVTQAEVTAQVTGATTATEAAIIEVNATVLAGVRLAHRTDIARFRRLCLAMLEELEAETAGGELFQQLGEMLRQEDDNGQDRRNDVYRKVISSASRIDSLKKLSETLKHLIGLEREAYGIATAEKPPGESDGLNETLAKLIEKLPG
jgi:hypothetical protein